MSRQLEQLLKKMTAEELKEVEFFAAFVIARRSSQKFQPFTDDIPTQELMQLVSESGSFDWLSAPEEEIYSVEDGEEIQWPQKL